jgi:hypothetical protein
MAQARPKNPYKVIPIPAGYRRALPKEITPKVQRAAVRALQQCLPLGKLQATEVDGKLYAFVTEGHYDDHVTKPGKPIWHPGISTLVPIKQPASVTQKASDALYAQAASIIQPAGRSGLWTGRVTGEGDMSNFEGEGLWGWFKKCFGSAPKTAVVGGESGYNQSDAFGGRQQMRTLAGRRARALAIRAKTRLGLEEDLESTYAADELYDAVNGEDFGDENGDEITSETGAEFGDDFGKFNFKKAVKKAAKGSLAISTGGLSLAASKKGRKIVKKVAKKAVSKKGLAAIATGGLSIAAQKKNRALSAAVLTGGLSLAAKKQRQAAAARLAAAKKRPAARPVARPVARPIAARPVARPTTARPVAARPFTPPRTTATKTDSPLGPSAPFDETMMQAPASNDAYEAEPVEVEEAEPMEMEASPEVEAAMDDYEAEGEEETPESDDEDSDTDEETAINGEGYTHSKYSIGA